MPRDMPVRIMRDRAIDPARELAHAFEETLVIGRGLERLRAAAGAVHRQVHGQAGHLVERHVLFVEILARQRLLAFRGEDLVGDA